MRKEILDRIVIDKDICHGKPCIKGTRIMVTNILSLMAGGYDIPRILNYYPELIEEDVKVAMEYVLESIAGEEVRLLQSVQYP